MNGRLERALRALKEHETGHSPAAGQTLERVLASQREARRARWRRARVWIPIAAVLAFSTAALARWDMMTTARAPSPPRDVAVLAPPEVATAVVPSAVAPTPSTIDSSEPMAPEAIALPPAPIVAPPALRGAPSGSVASAASAAPAVTASSPGAAASEAPSEADIYSRAHRLHFDGANPAAALAMWDDYLQSFPDGRFAPDARYNRAIDLLKLHRYAEGRAALRPFADGAYGGYHRDDARELLRSLPE